MPNFSPLVHHPANLHGRDFVVGDIHGMATALRQALDRVGFDPTVDRLFCVGDLVDRGPEPLACLELLREPWFFATLGNHERMLLAHEGHPERWITRFHAHRYTHRWASLLTATDRQRLVDLIPLVAALPWVRKIANHPSARGHYYVLHADRWSKGRILTDKELDMNLVASPLDLTLRENLTWSRRVAASALAARLSGQFKPHEPGVSLTYVGHTVVPDVIQHRSHVFIDRGAGMAALNGCAPGFQFPLVEHRPEGVG